MASLNGLQVGMMFECQSSKRSLDFVVRRCGRDLQCVIVCHAISVSSQKLTLCISTVFDNAFPYIEHTHLWLRSVAENAQICREICSERFLSDIIALQLCAGIINHASNLSKSAGKSSISVKTR